VQQEFSVISILYIRTQYFIISEHHKLTLTTMNWKMSRKWQMYAANILDTVHENTKKNNPSNLRHTLLVILHRISASSIHQNLIMKRTA
jgi:hypothetical protein